MISRTTGFLVRNRGCSLTVSFFGAEPEILSDSKLFGAEPGIPSDRETGRRKKQTRKPILPGRSRRESEKTPACFCHCCGARVAADAMFCQNCGARVNAAATAAPPLTAAAPKKEWKDKDGSAPAKTRAEAYGQQGILFRRGAQGVCEGRIQHGSSDHV